MMKTTIRKTITIFILCFTVFVLIAPSYILAEENKEKRVVAFNFTPEEVYQKSSITKTVEIEGQIIELKLDNISSSSFGESRATFTKRFTASTPLILSMSAIVNYSVHPYRTSIHKIYDGRFHSTLAQFIRDRYIIHIPGVTGSGYAYATYEVDYTTLVGGTLLAKLIVKVFWDGRIAVYLSY